MGCPIWQVKQCEFQFFKSKNSFGEQKPKIKVNLGRDAFLVIVPRVVGDRFKTGTPGFRFGRFRDPRFSVSVLPWPPVNRRFYRFCRNLPKTR